MQTRDVVITEVDKALGTREDGWNCPLARALFRETGVKWAVRCWMAQPIGTRAAFVNLGAETHHWITSFDRGSKVPVPFTVHLDAKQVSAALEAARAVKGSPVPYVSPDPETILPSQY